MFAFKRSDMSRFNMQIQLTCFCVFCFSSICSEDTVTQSWNNSNEERVGSHLWTLNEPMDLHFVLQFNMSLHNNWTSYTYVCEQDMIGNELLL